MPDGLQPDPSDDQNKCWICGYQIVNGKPCNNDDEAEACKANTWSKRHEQNNTTSRP
jgi:hypothetical protein